MASSSSSSPRCASMIARPAGVASSSKSSPRASKISSSSSMVVAPRRQRQTAVISAAATTERAATLPPASSGTGANNRRVMIIGERVGIFSLGEREGLDGNRSRKKKTEERYPVFLFSSSLPPSSFLFFFPALSLCRALSSPPTLLSSTRDLVAFELENTETQSATRRRGGRYPFFFALFFSFLLFSFASFLLLLSLLFRALSSPPALFSSTRDLIMDTALWVSRDELRPRGPASGPDRRARRSLSLRGSGRRSSSLFGAGLRPGRGRVEGGARNNENAVARPQHPSLVLNARRSSSSTPPLILNAPSLIILNAHRSSSSLSPSETKKSKSKTQPLQTSRRRRLLRLCHRAPPLRPRVRRRHRRQPRPPRLRRPAGHGHPDAHRLGARPRQDLGRNFWEKRRADDRRRLRL